MYEWLDDAVDDGATVLTSSRRLARDLEAVCDARRVATGAVSWATPRIELLADWLQHEFGDAAVPDAPVVLPPAAAAVLWEQCLERTAGAIVLSTAAIVRDARRAWRRLAEWGVPSDALLAAGGNADQRWFARAAAAFERRLRAGHWIDEAELPAYVAGLVSSGSIAPPARVVYAGFERVVPAVRKLFDALAAAGCIVTAAPPAAGTARCAAVSYADADAEWRAAGAFARRRLAAEPQARVAIVAPDLARDAVRIARLVREGFAPGWQIAGARHRAAVDISYGGRLAGFPLIAVALLGLSFGHRGLQGSEVSILLRSPFVGDDDFEGRCRLERFLRRLPDRRWSATDLLAAFRDSPFAAAGRGWRRRMAAIARFAARAGGTATPADWARRFDDLLAALGWPGVERPDSDEFQLLNRWRELLNELALTGVVRRRVTLGEALGRLQQLASDTIYQPESQRGAVHLLGMHEAAGMAFDALWIGGLDAGQWPPPSQPLSLVPRRLQQAFDMPDARPADTLRFAREVFARRLAAAASVTVSWPRTDGEAALAPSPLLDDDVVRAATAAADDPGWFAATLAGTGRHEWLDDPGPPVATAEQVRGGAYTVRQQQEDPFSGFARGRLAVRPLDAFQSGLSPRERGSILHRALQRLFAEKPARREIAAWPSASARVAEAVDDALRSPARHADAVLERLLGIERRRLQALLHAFLAGELERDEFSIVAVEEQVVHRHGHLSLSMRIDRIDRLADGSLLIIDYKSGRERALVRQSGELADMQLGVYARAVDGRIGGLLLLSLDSRAIAYKGIGASVPWGRVAADDWPRVLDGWLAQVDDLLTRLAQGDLRLNLRLAEDRARVLGVLSRIEEVRRDH